MSYYEATLSWLRDHWHELSPLRKKVFIIWLRIIRKEDRMAKEEVTLIEVTVAMRGKWDRGSVRGLIDDFRTECLSKPEFISIWESKIETKEMEILTK